MIKKHNYLLISGGTGGHIIPAVNLGNFIIEKGHKCYLIIDQRGKKYASAFNGKILIIRSSHFSYNFIGKCFALISFLFGFIQSLVYLIIFRPSLCIAFGSYATFMPLIILSFCKFFGKTKIYLHEQNSVMGKVNIFFTPFVNKIFLNFQETLKLKDQYKKKSFFVGMPTNNLVNYKLRNTNLDRKNIIKIFICGGSQGAVNLNKKLLALIMKMSKNVLNRIQVTIQCPDDQRDEVRECFMKLNIKYEIKYFFNNFVEKLYQTDVLIARAGAGTIRDVIFTQTPTIFIPLPSAANQHQFYNANYLIKKKAALMLKENDLDHNQSFLSLMQLINNFEQQVSIIKNLQKIKSFDTNELIYNHLNEKY